MKKENKQICRICRKEIKPPEIYWKSYDCCSACIRRAALELQMNSIQPKTIKDI